MDKKELEHKLEQAREDRESIFANIEKLKAQLAEPEKPKPLEHGDCCIDNRNGTRMIVQKQDHEEFPVTTTNERGAPCGAVVNGKHTARNVTVHFNAFDDLKALAEPLEEFEVQCDCFGSKDKIFITSEGCKDGCAYLKINNNRSIHFHGNSFHDFILNLRRMEATMQAK